MRKDTTITFTIGDQTITLTVDEARELRDEINNTIGSPSTFPISPDNPWVPQRAPGVPPHEPHPPWTVGDGVEPYKPLDIRYTDNTKFNY